MFIVVFDCIRVHSMRSAIHTIGVDSLLTPFIGGGVSGEANSSMTFSGVVIIADTDGKHVDTDDTGSSWRPSGPLVPVEKQEARFGKFVYEV